MKTTIICTLLLFAAKLLHAQVPIIKDFYTADPSARVFNDTLYIYPSHDEDTATWFYMKDWRVYSTVDMKTFEDRGKAFSLDDIKWASCCAWAPDCNYKNGKYYFYYPVDQDKIGVAVSDKPYGPFKDPLGKPLIAMNTPGVKANRDFIDPTVFIDEDGKAYMFVGQNFVNAVELGEDMISLNGKIHIIEGTDGFFEAPWLHKHNNTYYLSYSGRGRILYCTSKNIFGPYKYRGEILDRVNSGTNHHSIVEFKGKWYLFFHTANLAIDNIPRDHIKKGWHKYRRSIHFSELKYNDDGSIQKVELPK